MTPRYNVGDIVRLCPDCEFYEGPEDLNNPIDLDGIVTAVSSEAVLAGGLYLTVSWDNGYTNSYKCEHLDPK